MPVIATESTRFSAVVKYEFEPWIGYTRETITINDPAGGVYKVGSVLGKITASGKYRLALSASGDGSQTPAVLLITDGLGQSTDVVIPANTDVKVTAIVRGPVILADAGLSLGAGITVAAVTAAFGAINNPIIVETAV